MRTLAISLFVVTGHYSLLSQSTSEKNRLNFGAGINPIVFIDYTYRYSGEDFYPNWVTYGLDLNLSASVKRHTVELGVIAGNAFPVLHYLNYYVGYNYKVSPLKWKFDLLLNSKLMVMYHKDKSSYDITNEWQSYSDLIGATIQKTFNRIQLGVSYYAWINHHKYSESNGAHLIYSSSKTDVGRTGLILFKLNFLLKNRTQP